MLEVSKRRHGYYVHSIAVNHGKFGEIPMSKRLFAEIKAIVGENREEVKEDDLTRCLI